MDTEPVPHTVKTTPENSAPAQGGRACREANGKTLIFTPPPLRIPKENAFNRISIINAEILNITITSQYAKETMTRWHFQPRFLCLLSLCFSTTTDARELHAACLPY